MTERSLFYLMPLIILASAAVLQLVLIAVKRNHTAVFALTVIGFAAAFVSLFIINRDVPGQVVPLMIIDGYALLYIGFISLSSIAIAVLAFSYFSFHEEQREEFYVLLLTASLGAAALAGASHFVSFFMGLEVLSVSLYTMISYLREREDSIEAGIKYLVLAAASSAFLLFGMALTYAAAGTMNFQQLAENLGRTAPSPLLLTGIAMMVIAAGFKLALVPFHMWTPDVYQGAPAPVTAFVATVSKAGMFAVWLRFFVLADGYRYDSLVLLFTVFAVVTMFVGNFLALLQTNVKRILAYSSIAHMGYLFVSFISGGRLGIEAGTFYIAVYMLTTLGTFGVVTVLSTREKDADDIEEYRGLYWRHPWLATIFTAMLMSLAGIPLTAGFIGKFYLASSAVSVNQWLPVVVLVVNSVISIYYYLRIVVVMFRPREDERIDATLSGYYISAGGGLVLTVLLIGLVWIGVFPGQMIGLVKSMTGSLSAALLSF